jgi:hypothetical protein
MIRHSERHKASAILLDDQRINLEGFNTHQDDDYKTPAIYYHCMKAIFAALY